MKSAALIVAAVPLFAAASSGVTAIDGAGNVWRTGETNSLVTTATAFQKTATSQVCGVENLTPFQPPVPLDCQHAFLSEQDASGKVLYATYLAGSSQDGGLALTIDAAGNVYVAGYTYSADFPVTPGVVQAKNAGPTQPTVYTSLGAPFGPANVLPGGDVFVAKFTPGGALVFSTLLGGTGEDIPQSIGVDAAGAIYVAGVTQSMDFPTTTKALTGQGTGNFFFRLNANATALTFSTYYQSRILAFDVDARGRAYLTGDLAQASGQPYVAVLDTSSGTLVGSQALAGLAPGIAGAGTAIAVAPGGNLIVAVSPAPLPYNYYFYPNPPPRPTGASRLLALRGDASAILAETDVARAKFDSLQFDAAGNVYAFGAALGALPAAPVQLLATPCIDDQAWPFVIETNSAGVLLASTYFRQGSDGGVSVTSPGHLLAYRPQSSTTVPVDLTSQPAALFGCPANLASDVATRGIAPGEIFVITGAGLGPVQSLAGAPDAGGRYPTSLGGVQVLFDSRPAPLLYVQANEIHGVAPFSLNTVSGVQVQFGSNPPLPLDVVAAQVNPGIFAIDGQGAIVNQDGTVNTPANPAPLGSIVSVYCTGTGYLENPVVDGSIAPIPPPFNVTELAYPELKFAGVPGVTLWSGAAPGLIEGVTQINVQLPSSLPAGTNLGAVPLVLTLDGALSPPVNVSVKP